MNDRDLYKSAFENYKYTFYPETGGWGWQGGGVARAAIELSGDISPTMPLISKVVEGCSYSPEAHLIAFNLKGMSVIIEPNKITVYGMKDEAEARNIIDWLKQILDN